MRERERERESELSESRVPFARWPLPRSRKTPGTSRTFADRFTKSPQSWRNRKVNEMENVSLAHPRPRGRAPNALVAPDDLLRHLLRTPTPRCSGPREPGGNALVAPDDLLRQLLRTPTPRCSGPREPGGAAASIARRGRFEGSRRALAPARLPRPPSSEGRVGELHAHRDGVRAAASRSSPRSRACPPPNAQESERAKACKARRAQ